MEKISKRRQRILDAKARDKRETSRLRDAERAPVTRSSFAKFTPVLDKRTRAEVLRKLGK